MSALRTPVFVLEGVSLCPLSVLHQNMRTEPKHSFFLYEVNPFLEVLRVSFWHNFSWPVKKIA